MRMSQRHRNYLAQRKARIEDQQKRDRAEQLAAEQLAAEKYSALLAAFYRDRDMFEEPMNQAYREYCTLVNNRMTRERTAE